MELNLIYLAWSGIVGRLAPGALLLVGSVLGVLGVRLGVGVVAIGDAVVFTATGKDKGGEGEGDEGKEECFHGASPKIK
jgi:hypothetical protein